MAKIKLSADPSRDNISFSKIYLFERSPDEYFKRYFDLEPSFETKYMRFGKLFMEEVEAGKSDDFGRNLIIQALPKQNIIEYPIPDVQHNGYQIVGSLDSFGDDTLIVEEYKTGRTKWDQHRVDTHGQLDLYAYALSLNGIKIKKARLHWLPTTHDENGKVVLTGEIYTFTRKVDIEKIKKRVDAFIEGVANYKPKKKLTF